MCAGRRRSGILAAAALAFSVALLSACIEEEGPGIALLPASSGWQSLPLGSWLLNQGLGPVTIVYCGPSRCGKPSVAATFEAEGETASRLEQALADPKSLLMAKRFEVATARDPRSKRKAADGKRKSSEHVERLAADGIDGYRVTLSPEIAGGHAAFAVVLARREKGMVKVAFAVSTDPDTSVEEARAAANSF